MEGVTDYLSEAVVPALFFGAALFITYRTLQIYQAHSLGVLNADVCNAEYTKFQQNYYRIPLTVTTAQGRGQYMNQQLQNYYETLSTLGGCGAATATMQTYNVQGGNHRDCTTGPNYPIIFNNAPIVQFARSNATDKQMLPQLYDIYQYVIAQSAPTPGYTLSFNGVLNDTCVLPYELNPPTSNNVLASYCYLQAEAMQRGLVSDFPCQPECNGCGQNNVITKLMTCPNNIPEPSPNLRKQ